MEYIKVPKIEMDKYNKALKDRYDEIKRIYDRNLWQRIINKHV